MTSTTVINGVLLITEDKFPLNEECLNPAFRAWIENLPERLGHRLLLSARKLETPQYVYARLSEVEPVANEVVLEYELLDAMTELADTPETYVEVAYAMLATADDNTRKNDTTSFSITEQRHL